MTDRPGHDAMFNVLHPGPVLLARRPAVTEVRDLQARLAQIAWYFGDVTGTYDAATVAAVKGFQAKRQIPVTGEVDQRTLDRLHAMTRTPTDDELHNIAAAHAAAPLDPRCLTGRALCIDKTSRTLRWVVDGKVLKRRSTCASGRVVHPDPRGRCSTSAWKTPTTSRTLYGSSMPFAMFFSRRPGGALLLGLRGPRLRRRLARLRERARLRRRSGGCSPRCSVGDKVVVYWSLTSD